MAKARIGHFVEAQVLEALEVDYIDESEVLTPADEANHIDKWAFSVPFVCGATDLGEALRRIAEGAAMIRTKGEAGTGNVVEAVRHMRAIQSGIRRLASMDRSELPAAAKELRAPLELVRNVAAEGGLPVVNFSAGGLATPADAALMMQLGAEGVFVGSGIFKSSDPPARARAIVHATTHYEDPRAIARGLGVAGRGDGRPRRQGPGRGQPAPESWLVASRRRRRPASRPPRARGSACSPSRATSRPTADALRRLGAVAVEVRRPDQLDGLDGLILPGGESTTMSMGIESYGLDQPIRDFVGGGRPVFGTCAGLIMLDRAHLGLMDIEARRNAFGRQVRSFEQDVHVQGLGDEPLRAVFIRAPWIEEAGEGVEVLAEVDGHPVVGAGAEHARGRVPPRADRRPAPACPVPGHDWRGRKGRSSASSRSGLLQDGSSVMRDQRADALARILVHYSAAVQEGDVCVIQGEIASEPLALAVYEEVVKAGAFPIVELLMEGQAPAFFKHAKDAQLDWVSPTALWVAENADARIRLMADQNTRALSAVDPDRQTRRQAAAKPLMETMMRRTAAGEFRWALTLFPTHAYAAEADMSLADYEDFYYRACLCDRDDPGGGVEAAVAGDASPGGVDGREGGDPHRGTRHGPAPERRGADVHRRRRPAQHARRRVLHRAGRGLRHRPRHVFVSRRSTAGARWRG